MNRSIPYERQVLNIFRQWDAFHERFLALQVENKELKRKLTNLQMIRKMETRQFKAKIKEKNRLLKIHNPYPYDIEKKINELKDVLCV